VVFLGERDGEVGEGEPARGWKAAMKREWEEITGQPVRHRQKPLYTPAKLEALWAALPRANPRLRLAVEIGAELRLGQVIRVRRSDVRPSPDGSEPLWSIRVPGRGKKRGETVVLTEDQRAVLRGALDEGHLAELERLAGVASVPGRKWYGVRRRQADAADALDIRPGVKNRVGGWSKTSTREDYLEQGRWEDAVEAAGVRRRIRPARKESE
jgi:hypothetical protein